MSYEEMNYGPHKFNNDPAHNEVLEYTKMFVDFIAPQLHVYGEVCECMSVDIDVIFVNDGVHNF